MNKKGQEEIVGFVLIVVIVSIVLVILLVIFLGGQKDSSYKDSEEVKEFLTSAMEFTSNCSVSFIPDYLSLAELQKECRSNRVCLSGEDSCILLNKTMANLVNGSWYFGSERPIKGYSYESYYVLNRSSQTQSTKEEILKIGYGNCSGIIRGAEDLTRDSPGNIISRLELCY